MEPKKLSRSQAARLAGLARARSTDMALLGASGGTATVEKYGTAHMTRLALRKNGYAVKLETE